MCHLMNMKKKLITLNNMYEKEMQELKKKLKESKEYIDSDKKDKNIIFKKISELTEEKQKHKRKKNNRTRIK